MTRLWRIQAAMTRRAAKSARQYADVGFRILHVAGSFADEVLQA
jgi:hypothetical protein